MISKSLSTSRKYAELSVIAGPMGEFCQLLFPLLVSHADDFGRLSGDAFTVKFQVFPISPRPVEDFEAAIRHLDTAGLIEVYEADGDKFIQINKFDGHQTGLHKRSPSKIPESPGNPPEVPGIPGNPPGIPAQLKGTELNGTELKGREEKAAPLRPRAVTTSGVMAGTLPRDHLSCRPPCIRVCVSQKQHSVLLGRHGGVDADMDGFYADVRANLNGPVGQTPWNFWQEQFTARFGSPTALTPKTAGNAAVAARFIARGEQ